MTIQKAEIRTTEVGELTKKRISIRDKNKLQDTVYFHNHRKEMEASVNALDEMLKFSLDTHNYVK